MVLAGTSSLLARPARTVDIIAPHPRPHLGNDTPPPAPDPPMDLSHALPGKALATLPSSAEQFKTLNGKLQQQAPEVAAAKQKSDTLSAQAADLRHRLVDSAARIEALEREKADEDARIAALTVEDAQLSAGFANDRVAVTRLIAVLERLQHDMPPALAMRSDDALGVARGAMLIGASLPPVYARAAALSHRISALVQTRRQLAARRAQAEMTEKSLAAARVSLAVLLDEKEKQADSAAGTYGTLKAQLQQVASEAADFKALLARIARLRGQKGADATVITVTSQGTGSEPIARGSLRPPIVGTLLPPGAGPTPGISFASLPGAQVIAPADGKVLYAGPYHKSGEVLILEITTGYDLVLAGLGRVTVRSNDELLAGEPVGTMPVGAGADERLYFELRREGKGLDPSPWLDLELRKANKT